MSRQWFLAWFTAVVMASAVVVTSPPPARAGYTVDVLCVSFAGVDCPRVRLLPEGRKWHRAILVLDAVGAAPVTSEDFAAALSAVGSAEVDPDSPQWRELVLARFGAVAKRVAPVAPTFAAVIVEPAEEAVTAGLTRIGLAVADALGWLVAAELDPGKADGYRALALERLAAVRAAMLALAASVALAASPE